MAKSGIGSTTPKTAFGGTNAVTSVISAGNSIASAARSFTAMPYTVTFHLELENYSNEHLKPYQAYNHAGHISQCNEDVMPGMKEGLAGHKTGNTATGCEGTVAWQIGTTDKIVVVMYSVPYSHDLHSNWCGVGIFDVHDTSGHTIDTSDFFDKMYKDEHEDTFKRKAFWNDQDPVEYQDTNYRVKASMSSSHKATIKMGVAVIAQAIAAGAAVVGAGASVAGTAAGWAAMPHSITFLLELENYTNKLLEVHHSRQTTGLCAVSGSDVGPAKKEAMSGHNTSNAATGCEGTVAWKIGDTNKMVVVMYSVPYSHDLHSNWCGVGIFEVADRDDFFNMMYNDPVTTFSRKGFYYDTNPITYEDEHFKVSATMATDHKPDIQVKLYPKKLEDLATELQKGGGLAKDLK